MSTYAQGGLDTNVNPSAFKLAELGYDSYRLIGTKPSTSYILDAIPCITTISPQGWVVALGKISNRKSTVSAIPFTEGSAADTSLIAGGAVLGIVMPAMMAQAYRRRWALDS